MEPAIVVPVLFGVDCSYRFGNGPVTTSQHAKLFIPTGETEELFRRNASGHQGLHFRAELLGEGVAPETVDVLLERLGVRQAKAAYRLSQFAWRRSRELAVPLLKMLLGLPQETVAQRLFGELSWRSASSNPLVHVQGALILLESGWRPLD